MLQINDIVLYCIILYCIVLYCIVSYRIVSYRIVSYRIVLYCIVLYCIVLYCISLYLIVLSPSHLSASTLRSVPARITTCQCLRSSAISVVIWFLAISSFTRSRHLSFGLPRFLFPSTVICNIFLVASSLSLLCTCPNHLNLYSLRNSAIGYMCASFQMSTFLTWSSLAFPLAHRSMRISVVCNFLSSFFLTAQHSDPYTMAGFIAVLYTLSFNLVGMFLSHITPVVSLHFDQAIFTLLFTSFSHCITLYYIVLHCIVLYCIVLQYIVFIVLYYIVSYRIASCCIVLYRDVSCCILLYRVVSCCVVLCRVVSCCVVLYYVVLCRVVL